MSNDANVRSCISASLGQEVSGPRFGNVLDQGVARVDDCTTGLDETKAYFHVFSMVPRRVKTPHRQQGFPLKHRAGPVGQTRSSRPGPVLCCDFDRPKSAHQVVGLLKHGSSGDGDDPFRIVKRLNVSHHVGNPVGFRANIDVRDGDPLAGGMLDRPLTSSRQPKRGLVVDLHGDTTRSLRVVERVKHRFCTVGRAVVDDEYF